MKTAIGIDVYKATLDVSVLIVKKSTHRQVSNDLAGWCELATWFTELGAANAQICMESTGVYSLGVARYFFEQGYCVSVVNPARTRAFAGSLLQRNKTDKSDAYMIALFCQRMRPDPWQPKTGLQFVLTAAAMNLTRVLNWQDEHAPPRSKTRVTRFGKLAA